MASSLSILAVASIMVCAKASYVLFLHGVSIHSDCIHQFGEVDRPIDPCPLPAKRNQLDDEKVGEIV